MTSPPMTSREARRAMARVEPTTVWSRVVSEVRREMISPVRVVSKKPTSSPRTRPKTAARISAMTRSPNPAQQIGPGQDGPGHGQHHGEEELQGAVEGGLGAYLEPGVHDLADHLAKGQHGPGGHQEGQHGQQHAPQVGVATKPSRRIRGLRLRVVGRCGRSEEEERW